MNSTWNATLYDTKHQFVSKYGEGLISFLNPQAGEQILDVGCGTGDLAAQIAESASKVIGIDQSASMIEQASQKFKHIPFQVKDAQNLGYSNQFDAVFSNAALHWMKSQEKAVASIYEALKDGGRFVAELGGKGNIQSIVEAIQQSFRELGYEYKAEKFPWYFPSVAEYVALLDEHGFNVHYVELYNRPTELSGEDGILNWLNMFSDSLLEHLTKIEKEKVIKRTEEHLKTTLYQDGKWIADYYRLRVLATK
ncbi:methyltransferase domain-containing protein [Viridibacillus arvi]